MRANNRISGEDIQPDAGRKPFDASLSDSVRQEIEQTIRQHYGRMLAILIHQFGDINLAEDALQEATLVALKNWSEKGVPGKPVPWLMRTAKNKAIDKLRRQDNYLTVEQQLKVLGQMEREGLGVSCEEDTYPDRRLSLIFTCCHPALEHQVRVALTLKTLCGLSTSQIASAFLVSRSTMAQRIVRAKHKIKSAGVPFEVPAPHLIEGRLDSVLAVIYFIFNEGYYCSNGNELLNLELCHEAIHLSSMMLKLLPGEPEIKGLHALLLFHHARAASRVDSWGELIDLIDQDRSNWDRSLVTQADQLLKEAMKGGRPGTYQIQAAISALHAHASSFESTDWIQIVMLYQKLESIDRSPVVQLNLAVALSYAEDPVTALMYLDQIGGLDRLKTYHPYYLTRADLLHRLGHLQEAGAMYQKAIKFCSNSVEKEHMLKKMRGIAFNQ